MCLGMDDQTEELRSYLDAWVRIKRGLPKSPPTFHPFSTALTLLLFKERLLGICVGYNCCSAERVYPAGFIAAGLLAPR